MIPKFFGSFLTFWNNRMLQVHSALSLSQPWNQPFLKGYCFPLAIGGLSSGQQHLCSPVDRCSSEFKASKSVLSSEGNVSTILSTCSCISVDGTWNALTTALPAAWTDQRTVWKSFLLLFGPYRYCHRVFLQRAGSFIRTFKKWVQFVTFSPH